MGYTLEELQKAGFKPVPEEEPKKRFTLEELEAMGFKAPPVDPYAQGLDLSRPLPRKIDPRRAFVLGASQGGTLGTADEIGGVVAEAGAKPAVSFGPAVIPSASDTPEERAIKEEIFARRLAQMQPGGDPLSYQAVRDSMRAEAAKAAQDQPRYYTTGEALGGVGAGAVSGAIPVLNTGAPSTARVLRMALGGPGLGAAQGFGASNAPLGSAQSAKDTLAGAALGTVGEAGGAVVGKLGPKLLKRTGEMLEKRGVDNARKVLTSGSGQLNRHMTSDAAPRIALEEKAIPLFGTTETAYRRLEPLAEAEGKRYASIVERLEAAGVPGEKARDIADELNQWAYKDWVESGADKSVANRYSAEAENLENIVDPNTGNLRLGQGEAIKRRAQAEARGDYLQAGPDSPMGDAKKRIASRLRQSTENAIDAAAAAPGAQPEVVALAKDFVPVKRRLGPLIEARDTAELGTQKFQSRTSGAMPGGLEIAGALASQNPAVLLGGPLRAIAKERLPSLVARSQFGAGRGLQSVAGRMAASGNTLPFTGGTGSVLVRTLGARPEAPDAPEPPPEGSDLDLERWRLEQEIQGRSAPVRGVLKRTMAARRAPAGGTPTDRSRPILQNPDGSFSTERTITIEADGRQVIIPTIVGGQQRTPQEAVRMWRSGANPAVGVFNTPAEAEAYAQRRSQEIGRVRGAESQGRR